jgi:hypothetical protein
MQSGLSMLTLSNKSKVVFRILDAREEVLHQSLTTASSAESSCVILIIYMKIYSLAVESNTQYIIKMRRENSIQRKGVLFEHI